MRHVASIIPGVIILLIGCSERPLPQENANTAVAVPRGDVIIEAASEKARASVSEFIETLAKPSANQSDFSVKVPIINAGTTHSVWLQHLSHDGSKFLGRLGPDVEGMSGHAPGDEITVAPKDIEDWMYVENGKLVGGYTLRAIRDQLSGPARENFERSMWFKFD
jgi:uncharacterized protein YegJ (DUF2314 family)